MNRWEARFANLAQRQDGLVARFQLPDIDCTTEDWRSAGRTGRWELVSDRVLRAGGSPRADAQWVAANVLDASPGAILHGPSTLAWMGIGPYTLAKVLVARQRGASGRRARLAEVHRLRNLRAHDVIVVRGVATESALRAIWAVAAPYAPERRFEVGLDKIGHLLDDANRKGWVTWAGLHEMVEGIQQRGRAATRLMRALAESRPPGTNPTESRLERRFEKILEERGVRGFVRQRWLGGHEPVGRIDERDEQFPLALEVNSTTFHTAPTDRAADERRHQSLNNAGFTVAVIWEDDIFYNPAGVVATVREARRLAAAGIRAVVHSPACPWPDPYLGVRP